MRLLAVRAQDMNMAILPHRPYEMAVGVVHQAHRIIEDALTDGVGAGQVGPEPGVAAAVIEQPEHLAVSAGDAGADQYGVPLRQVDRLARRRCRLLPPGGPEPA